MTARPKKKPSTANASGVPHWTNVHISLPWQRWLLMGGMGGIVLGGSHLLRSVKDDGVAEIIQTIFTIAGIFLALIQTMTPFLLVHGSLPEQLSRMRKIAFFDGLVTSLLLVVISLTIWPLLPILNPPENNSKLVAECAKEGPFFTKEAPEIGRNGLIAGPFSIRGECQHLYMMLEEEPPYGFSMRVCFSQPSKLCYTADERHKGKENQNQTNYSKCWKDGVDKWKPILYDAAKRKGQHYTLEFLPPVDLTEIVPLQIRVAS